MSELISVIMSVYKEEREELLQAIKSILNQTYTNFEFIIIIDNPDDNWRRECIQNINDKRIKLIVNDVNLGLPKSLNKALELAKGKYIARMDADDISELDRLEKQKEFIETNNYDLCGSNFISFYNDSEKKVVRTPKRNKFVNKLLKYTNCVGHPTWFGKKDVFEKNEGYRNIFSCEDYDFLLRAVQKGYLIGNVQENLLRYRININSISRANAGKQILLANFLVSKFKKNCIATEKEIYEFLNSKKIKKELKKYDQYYEIKYKKNSNKSNKLLQMFYMIRLSFFIKFFIRDLIKVLYTKFILHMDKK